MKNIFEEFRNRIREFGIHFRQFSHNLLLFIQKGFRQILGFSLICLVLSFLVTELMDYLFPKIFSNLTHIPFLEQYNGVSVTSNPVAITLAALYLIIASFLSLFEIAGLVYAYSMIQVGREAKYSGMLEAAARTCRKTLKPVNWPIILFLFILLPLTGVITLSSSGMKLSVPYFLTQGIEANPIWNRYYRILYFFLLMAELTYLFSIHIYVLRDVNYIEACKEGRKLIKGNLIHTVMTMALLSIGLNFLLNTLSAAIPMNIAELISLFQKRLSIMQRSSAAGIYVYVLRTIFKGLLAPAVYNAGLTILFFEYVEARNLLGKLTPRAFSSTWESTASYRIGTRIMAAIIASIFLFFVHHYGYLGESVEKPLVCAHRGDNTNAPENTLESIELALTEQTPLVEVDVYEAADGTIVVTHDENLLRVTGHNVKVTDKTFEELQKYEMLDTLPGNYSHVKVPSLESVIKAVKEEGAILQIELKANGHEKNLEREVIRLINKYDMRRNVIVISLKSYLIENIKQIDPDVPTAVCAFMAWDSYADYPYGDMLSVSDSAVTPDLVKAMHDAGKLVLCWTVDDEDLVQYLVSCNVDVIGTNDPLVIQRAIDVADTDGGISRVSHVLMERLSIMSR